MDFVGGLVSNGERSAEFPAVGNLQRSGVVDVVGLPSLGIEQDLVPTDDGELVGGRGAGGETALRSGGRKIIEFGGDFGGAGGNFDVDRPAIEQIAPPLQGLTSGGEL